MTSRHHPVPAGRQRMAFVIGLVLLALVTSACAPDPEPTLRPPPPPPPATTVATVPSTTGSPPSTSLRRRPPTPTPSKRPTGASARRSSARKTTSTPESQAPPTRVVLVGDSMVREARFALADKAPSAGLDLRVIDRSRGAPCNQLDQILTELAATPDVLVVEWVGNARFTVPCTKTFTPDEVVAEYRTALDRIIAARPAATTIALVGAPPIELQPWSTTWAPLDALYRELAQANAGVDYIDTTSTLAPAGTFTRTLPCAAADGSAESCGTHGAAPGQAVIRDPLGFHFCPVKYDFGAGDCPVPSPGAALYAKTILAGITRIIGPR